MAVTHDEKRADAQDSYEWLQAYLEAGFTEDQAMRILTRPWVTIQQQANYPPELHEFWDRQTALATKLLTESDDDDDD